MIPVIPPASSSPSAPAPPPGPSSYSALQVVTAVVAGAPVLPVLAEDGPPVAFGDMLGRVAEGNVRGVRVGSLNNFLSACGRIPMLDTQAPRNASQPAADDEDLVPVVCTFCNCAFCFPEHMLSVLNPPQGLTYRRFPGPATPDLNTEPLVGPLCGGRGGALPGGQPVPLMVCSDRHHFAVAMGMLNLPSSALPVEWRRPAALGVVPVAVGTRGGGGVLQHEERAPEASSSGARAPPPPSPNA